jgi:hypothetical protein
MNQHPAGTVARIRSETYQYVTMRPSFSRMVFPPRLESLSPQDTLGVVVGRDNKILVQLFGNEQQLFDGELVRYEIHKKPIAIGTFRHDNYTLGYARNDNFTGITRISLLDNIGKGSRGQPISPLWLPKPVRNPLFSPA